MTTPTPTIDAPTPPTTEAPVTKPRKKATFLMESQMKQIEQLGLLGASPSVLADIYGVSETTVDNVFRHQLNLTRNRYDLRGGITFMQDEVQKTRALELGRRLATRDLGLHPHYRELVKYAKPRHPHLFQIDGPEVEPEPEPDPEAVPVSPHPIYDQLLDEMWDALPPALQESFRRLARRVVADVIEQWTRP